MRQKRERGRRSWGGEVVLVLAEQHQKHEPGFELHGARERAMKGRVNGVNKDCRLKEGQRMTTGGENGGGTG